MNKPLTYSDYDMFQFFYHDKGDITRYSGWDLAQVKLECPELAYAYEQMENARKVFEAVLAQAKDKAPQEN